MDESKKPVLGKQARFAVIGLAVALVLAGGAIGGWAIASNATPRAGADGPAEPASASSATESSAIATPPADIVPNHTFKSQSGNLRCSVGLFTGEPGAICQQISVKYAVPPDVCNGGTEGVFVGVGPDGAYWPCVGVWREPDEVIAYDTPVTQSGVTCVISYTTGAKCSNEDGHGFTMEYTAGITTF